MKKKISLIAILVAAVFCCHAQKLPSHPDTIPADLLTLNTQWQGRTVAFLGDSMTDPRNSAAKIKYWEWLRRLMGIDSRVFARSGFEWDGIYKKTCEMRDSLGDNVDAVLIWAGTNDYNHSKPIGEFYTETVDTVNVNGKMLPRKHREWVMTDSTFCGNINRVMSYLKQYYPTAQIVIMTPIHRGLADFNERNVQPDEDYANGQGLYLETYIDTLKRAATLWAVPVIDLHSISGLYPNFDSNTGYIAKEATDRLHPNNNGHYRLARTIQTQLLTLPVGF